MKVRKGQRCIKLQCWPADRINSATWKSGSDGDGIMYYLGLITPREMKRMKNKRKGNPNWVAFAGRRMYFHPAAPCTGEITVDFFTRHVL